MTENGLVISLVLALALGVALIRQARTLADLRRSEALVRRGYEDMSQFAHIVAHDLQSPLATISGFACLLQEQYTDCLDETGQSYVDFLVSEAQAASRKVDGLLQFSRIGNHSNGAQRINTTTLVNQVVGSLQADLTAAGGQVTVGPLPPVMADPVQLSQIFQNLINNALKYRHPDRPPRIMVSGRQDRLWVHFRVTDNGQGIPAGYEEKVFAIFGRLHDSQTPGDGIGLALSRRIVERYGGSIWYESHSDQGTTFWFTIPRGDE